MWRSPKVITSAASGTLGSSAGWSCLPGGPGPVRLFVAAILSGAFYFGRKALSDLFLHRVVGFYFLISAAAVVSALIGHAQEGGILVFLTSISEAAQDFTEWKTRSAIHALMNLAPKTALVCSATAGSRRSRWKNFRSATCSSSSPARRSPPTAWWSRDFGRQPGADHRREPAGNQGAQAIRYSPPASTVPAALKVRATKTFADNTVARIIRMVQEAQENKGSSQRFIERFGARYSPIVVVAAVLIAVLPPLLRRMPTGTPGSRGPPSSWWRPRPARS